MERQNEDIFILICTTKNEEALSAIDCDKYVAFKYTEAEIRQIIKSKEASHNILSKCVKELMK